jgi:hypothetical protein
VQGVQDHVGAEFGQDLRQVAARVDAADLGDLSFQGVGTPLARRQRHLPFGRQPSHQDGDMQL